MMQDSLVEKNSNRQIKYGAICSYIALATNILAGFVYTPWIMHQIGANAYGLYTIAISLISMFVMDFGISSAISKFVAEYRAKGDTEKVNRIVSVSMQLYLLIDAVILIVLVIIYFFLGIIYDNFSASDLENFRVVYAIVACFNVVAFPFIPMSGILTAYERFIGLNVCEIVNKVMTVALTIIALCNGFGLYALVTIKALSDLFIIAIKVFLVKKDTGVKFSLKYHDKQLFRDILSFSVWVTIMTIAQRIVINMVPSIIGAVIGAAGAAIFGVAITLENYSYSLGNVFSNMFLPKVSRMVMGDCGREELTKLMVDIGKIQFFIGALVSGGFLCAGKDFMLVWMGTEYIDAYYCAVLLIFPKLFVWPLMIGTTALTAINRVKEHSMVNVLMAIISLVFEVLLIGKYGIIGSAMAIAISYIFQAIAMMYLYHKFLNVDLKRFMLQIYGRLLPVLMLAVIVGCIENYILPVSNWMTLIIEIGIIGITFLVIFYLGFWNKKEREKIKGRLFRR